MVGNFSKTCSDDGEWVGRDDGACTSKRTLTFKLPNSDMLNVEMLNEKIFC